MKKIQIYFISILMLLFLIGCSSAPHVLKSSDTLQDNNGIGILVFQFSNSWDNSFSKVPMTIWIKNTETNISYYYRNSLSGNTQYLYLPKGEYILDSVQLHSGAGPVYFSNLSDINKAMYGYKFTIDENKINYIGQLTAYLTNQKVDKGTRVYLTRIDIADNSIVDISNFKKSFPKYTDAQIEKKIAIKLK